MASWTKTKDLNAINGGEEFTKGKKLSRSSLNAIINNTLNAQGKIDDTVNNMGTLGKGEKGLDGNVLPIYFRAELSSGEIPTVSQDNRTYTFGFPKGIQPINTSNITGYRYDAYSSTQETREKIPISVIKFKYANDKELEIWQFSLTVVLTNDNYVTSPYFNNKIRTEIPYDNYKNIDAVASSSFRATIVPMKRNDGYIEFAINFDDLVANVPTVENETIFNYMVILRD